MPSPTVKQVKHTETSGKFGHPKNAIRFLKLEYCDFTWPRIMCPKDADGMASSVNPDLGQHYIP